MPRRSPAEHPEGRPLFAGHVSLPWPDEPHLVLWHAQTLLREYRGDNHIAALTDRRADRVRSARHPRVRRGAEPRRWQRERRRAEEHPSTNRRRLGRCGGVVAGTGLGRRHGHGHRARSRAAPLDRGTNRRAVRRSVRGHRRGAVRQAARARSALERGDDGRVRRLTPKIARSLVHTGLTMGSWLVERRLTQVGASTESTARRAGDHRRTAVAPRRRRRRSGDQGAGVGDGRRVVRGPRCPTPRRRHGEAPGPRRTARSPGSNRSRTNCSTGCEAPGCRRGW